MKVMAKRFHHLECDIVVVVTQIYRRLCYPEDVDSWFLRNMTNLCQTAQCHGSINSVLHVALTQRMDGIS
jgi:hypothetical protein